MLVQQALAIHHFSFLPSPLYELTQPRDPIREVEKSVCAACFNRETASCRAALLLVCKFCQGAGDRFVRQARISIHNLIDCHLGSNHLKKVRDRNSSTPYARLASQVFSVRNDPSRIHLILQALQGYPYSKDTLSQFHYAVVDLAQVGLAQASFASQ